MSLFGRKRSNRKGNRGGILPLLVVAVILGMALAPMIQTSSAFAEDNKPRISKDIELEIEVETQDPQIDLDPEIVQVEPTPTERVIDLEADPEIDIDNDLDVMPTEEPVLDPEIDVMPEATTEAVGPGSVYINKHGCPAGYDGAAKSFNDLAADCGEPVNGIEFGISDGAQFVQSQLTGDVVGSGVVFDGVAAGPYSILEQVPDGFGAPRVFCNATLPGGEGGPASFGEESVLDGNQIFHLLQDGESFYCDWFNFPAGDVEQADGDGTISISKTECPIGYDAYAADIYDLTLNCQAPLAGITFLLSDGAQAIGQSATDGNGAAGFTGVPAAPVSIVEQVPAGYGEPIVYCQFNDPTIPQAGETVKQQVLDSNQIFAIMPEGGEINCLWFNVPTFTTDAGDGAGTISITKAECPVGFDAYAADVYDLAYNCNQPMEGVTFLLSDGASAIAQSISDANGSVGFTDVPAIPVSIVEQVPAGYGAPRVFCIFNVPTDNAVGETIEQQVLDGNQIFHLMLEEQSVSCTWYNIPDAEGGEVVVYKWECPEIPGYSDDMATYLESEGCTRLDGIDFLLAYGLDSLLPRTTGDDGVGTVAWSGLPEGPVHVTETVPDGYGEPVVFCTWETPGEATPLTSGQVEIEQGSTTFQLAENQRIVCNWINIPYEDGSITIIKYTCPEGYDVQSYGAAPYADCTEKTNGVEFTVTGDNYQETLLTGSAGDGTVTFDPIPAGDYTVTESIPYDTEYVFVLECEGLSGGWIQGTPLSFGPELEIPVAASDHIICYWFNVPQWHDGQILITKYVCPTEYFVVADDCVIYEKGVGFQLSAYDGSNWLEWGNGTTNGGGELVFGDLEPGTYQIDEIGSDWCYAVADKTTKDGYLLVNAGETTFVDVWNCGVTYENEKPTKYPNTGVAPASVTIEGANAPVGSRTQPVLRPDQWQGVMDARLTAFVDTGERPVSLRVSSVGIDASTESLEIIDGEMQDPTTANNVAWYKETSKLGTGSGNVVIAGHLNYWGAPEAVFYRLDDIQVGDEIVVKGDRGSTYIYRVTWVENVDAFSDELSEVAGQTDESVLTLITCGGEWDPNVQLYNQRTIVRAEFVSAS